MPKIRISKRGDAYLTQIGNYRALFATEAEARQWGNTFAHRPTGTSWGRYIMDTLGPTTTAHLWDFSGGLAKGTTTDTGSRVSYDFGDKTDLGVIPQGPTDNGMSPVKTGVLLAGIAAALYFTLGGKKR